MGEGETKMLEIIAEPTTQEILKTGLLGALLVASIIIIWWLFKRLDKKDDSHAKFIAKQEERFLREIKDKDDKFTQALDKHAANADKMADALRDIGLEIARNRTGGK